MQLFKMIHLKLGGKFYKELALKMGYKNIDKAVERIKSIEMAQTTYEWLKSGGFDMKYSNEEFLIALCKLLAIKPSSYDAPILEAKKRLSDLENMREPYIFIDTGFKRKGETIISLGALQYKRRLKFDKEEFLYTPEKEFLEIVSCRIKEHYATSGGKLDLWGEVQKYIFHDKYNIAHTFDINGVKISERFNDLFGYLKRYAQEYDNRIFERDKYQLISMVFDDVRENILQKNLEYRDSVLELQLSAFNMKNIKGFIINAEKQVQKTSALFLMDNYAMMVHVIYHDKQITFQFVPICAYKIECLADKNKLYQTLYDYLETIARKENIFKDEKWTQIPLSNASKIVYKIKKSYVDLVRNHLISNVKKSQKTRESQYYYTNEDFGGSLYACDILEEFYKEKFITKETLINSLIEFGRLALQLRYISRVEIIAKRIYKLTREEDSKLASKAEIWKRLKTSSMYSTHQ